MTKQEPVDAKDRKPPIGWSNPRARFLAWPECSHGTPCGYTGLSYDKLRGGSNPMAVQRQPA